MNTQTCPACAGMEVECTLCRGSRVVQGNYYLGAWFDADTIQQPRRAIMVNFPGGCGAIVFCAGGTTARELVGSLQRMIDHANANAAKGGK